MPQNSQTNQTGGQNQNSQHPITQQPVNQQQSNLFVVQRDNQNLGHSTSNNNLSQITDKASIVGGATVSNSTIIMQHSNLNTGQLNNRSSIDSNTH